MGVLRDYVWENEQFNVETDDVLVLYTHGVIEARDREQRPFGNEKLVEPVRNGPHDANALLGLLRDELIAHQGSALGVDDQTLIVLRISH